MKRVLAMAVILVVGLAAAGSVFTQNTLHVVRRTGKAAGNPVQITAQDGSLLRASWFANGNTTRCVAVLHGISDSRASSAGFAPLFLENGYSVLAPDSRAHGESGGDVVTYGLLEKHDDVAWARWMRSQGCERVYGLGESLGGSVLIQSAALGSDFSAIVVESAYADLQEAAEHRLRRMLPLPELLSRPLVWLAAVNGKWYARWIYGLDLSSASPLDAMRTSRTPTLLIHGLADDQTPPDHSRRLANANPKYTELWLVPGIGHASSYSADPQQYRRRVLGWFADH